jgi:hypothetical protein
MTTNQSDDHTVLNWETQKLLREVAALRQEVVECRRAIAEMRTAAGVDTIAVIVSALERLPERMRNRRRGFRRIGEEKGSL